MLYERERCVCISCVSAQNAFHIVIIHVYSGYIHICKRMVQTIAYYNLIKFVMFRVYELFAVFHVRVVLD